MKRWIKLLIVWMALTVCVGIVQTAYVSEASSASGDSEDGDDGDDGDDGEDDEDKDTPPVPYSTNSKLIVCDNWVTPTAVAGQSVNVVIPITNMDKYDVKDVYVEPVLAEDVESFPFEIEKSSYMVKLDTLLGSSSIEDPLERRQEITYVWKTRKDAVTGYKKLTFEVAFTNINGDNETCTLELYVYIKGKSSSGSGQSVPRVIVTGYTTEPETIHAGESFSLKIMLQNTSSETAVQNMKIEFQSSEESADDKTTEASFIPVAGSNTMFVDSIKAEATKEISIDMTARTDLAQNSYQLGVSLEYEDESANAFTTTSSVSIPVKQDAKFDISSIETLPASIAVGSECNVMFSIYNTGKTTLYNVMVGFQADSVSGGNAFVGNIEPGATGNVDAMLTGAAPTADDGTVKVTITYEDVNGEASSVERSMTLTVQDAEFEEEQAEEVDEEESDEDGGSFPVKTLLVVVLLAAAACIAVLVLHKIRSERQKQLRQMIEVDKNYYNELQDISLDEPKEGPGEEPKDE